jgi:hypothetical protein
MKKSVTVRIPLVTTLAAAALAAGCGSKQPQGWQTCVDRVQGTAVAQQYCDQEAPPAVRPGYVPHYSWYYYPRGYYWDGPAIGSRVPGGGSYSATPFHSTPMARTGAVVRGGLGSTAAGHSSSTSHSASSHSSAGS